MKVPFVHAPGVLQLDEIEAPRPGPRDVVIRVATCGICGSDFAYTSAGGIAGPTGRAIPLGHELSGTIEALGVEVRGWAPGDRVILNPYFNAIGNGGPEGGFADRLLVRDVVGLPAQLIRMPDGLSFDTAALAEPLAVSLHAVNRSGARPGDPVAIYGAGPIGLGAISLFRQRGIDDVVAFDLSPLRRERALRLGARAAIDPREESARDALSRLHGTTSLWGADTVATRIFIDMAGAPGIVEDVLDIAPLGARLIVVAVHKKPVTLNFQTFLAKEMTISASMGYPDEFGEVLDLLSGGIDVEPMVSHRFGGENFMAAFEAAGDAASAAKVLVQYDR